MKIKFKTFFALVALTGILSISDSWIIQSQLHGGIDPARAIFQIGFFALILYMLWKRSTPSYVVAAFYVVGNAAIYGYELAQFFILGNLLAKLPTSATIVSVLLIFAALSAIILFALDYLDYRKRRVPIDL